ncbi:hypothetical protein [Catenulispora subtropica]|uniref:Uncharacterized protein n=1 Tax=Catenulispora subtropica TaxID=450798 RepID=A0ABN2SVR2_9ACTN
MNSFAQHAADPTREPARYGRKFPGLEPLDYAPDLLLYAGERGNICDGSTMPNPGGAGDDAVEAAGWPVLPQA